MERADFVQPGRTATRNREQVAGANIVADLDRALYRVLPGGRPQSRIAVVGSGCPADQSGLRQHGTAVACFRIDPHVERVVAVSVDLPILRAPSGENRNREPAESERKALGNLLWAYGFRKDAIFDLPVPVQ